MTVDITDRECGTQNNTIPVRSTHTRKMCGIIEKNTYASALQLERFQFHHDVLHVRTFHMIPDSRVHLALQVERFQTFPSVFLMYELGRTNAHIRRFNTDKRIKNLKKIDMKFRKFQEKYNNQ